MRKLMTVVPCLVLFALPAFSQSHVSRFELTETYVVDQWSKEPVRDEQVSIDGVGPLHPAAQDCEVHMGAEFKDSSFTDFPKVVLEPPNMCKPPKITTVATLQALAGKDCTAHGFLRAWPEHLTSGSGASNPNHVLEVHPMVTLTCGQKSFDFTPKLKAFDDLGYKSPDIVNKMMDMQVWICRGCSAEDGMLAFDYCFGDPCKAGTASNFARMTAEIIPSTIRTGDSGGSGPIGAATVIARITPADSTDNRVRPLKLYAVKGTKFYDDVIAAKDATGEAPSFEILGIFTLDPFSIKRVIEAKPADGTWTSVPHPVSLVVFGEF